MLSSVRSRILTVLQRAAAMACFQDVCMPLLPVSLALVAYGLSCWTSSCKLMPGAFCPVYPCAVLLLRLVGFGQLAVFLFTAGHGQLTRLGSTYAGRLCVRLLTPLLLLRAVITRSAATMITIVRATCDVMRAASDTTKRCHTIWIWTI